MMMALNMLLDKGKANVPHLQYEIFQRSLVFFVPVVDVGAAVDY